MKTALILVDIQNDYFPGGKNELAGSIEASKQAKKLLDYFRQNQLLIIHVQHISLKKDAKFFVPDTKGAEIHSSVKHLNSESVIVKHYPNSFRETGLTYILTVHKIEQLVICGMMSHMCVDSTVRAAFDFGYQCILAQDACATKNLQFGELAIPSELVHGSFMSAINGTFARVVKTDEVISLI